MNKIAGVSITLALGAALAAAAGSPKNPCHSMEGCVPNEETAIAIAVAVWNPVFGKEKIAGERPFHAQLSKGVWTVQGTLPDGWKGGDRGGSYREGRWPHPRYYASQMIEKRLIAALGRPGQSPISAQMT